MMIGWTVDEELGMGKGFGAGLSRSAPPDEIIF